MTTVLRTMAAAAALALAIAGCSASSDEDSAREASVGAGQESPDAILAPYDLDGLSGREVVDTLEAMPIDQRPADLMASVQPTELLLTSGDMEAALPLPDDAYYLSVAPYVDQTHPCAMHSLTTCRGELGGQDVTVEVLDDATGEILVDGIRTAADNGFIGLWLPRDIDATITLEYDGKSAVTSISTGADAETCLTTMQLR